MQWRIRYKCYERRVNHSAGGFVKAVDGVKMQQYNPDCFKAIF